MKPCAHQGCGTPTDGTRCPQHQRNPNLARNLLPWLIHRDRNRCHICGTPCGPRGIYPHAPTIDHLNGNVTDNTPTNLRLAHHNCNNTRHPTQTR